MRVRPAFPLLPALAVLLATPAWSHAILMDSTPRLAGQAAAGEQTITLRYNSLVDVKRSRLALIDPDAQQTRLRITGGNDTIHASANFKPGHNVLRWQVLAIDGHITRGDVPFDVTTGLRTPGH